jgi:hypothetical protein
MALALGACGKPPAPPVVVEASEVEPRVFWGHDLEGQHISVDGYIGLDNGPKGDAIAMGQVLTTQPLGAGEQLFRFDLKRGDGPNQINLPVVSSRPIEQTPMQIQTVDLSSATFHDRAGGSHPLSDRVRVTARLRYDRVKGYLLSDEDPRSLTGKRFKPRLTDIVLEPAPAG